MKRTLSIAMVLAACGGSPKPTTGPTAPAHDEKAEMANAPPALGKFHDVLAPRWHAAKGAERMTATCGAIAEFAADADGIAKSTPTKGDASKWAQEAKELTEAVAALKTTCDAKDAAGFETAFANVHQEFHELLEVANGEGEKHEEHEEHGGY